MADTTESLQRIEVAVTAILMLMADRAKYEDRPKDSVSIEGMMYQAGFTTVKDIVAITGTPKSTVSDRLKEDGLR